MRYVKGGPTFDKAPRPRLCGRCGAHATWALETPLTIMHVDLDAQTTVFGSRRLDYFCAYHAKTA